MHKLLSSNYFSLFITNEKIYIPAFFLSTFFFFVIKFNNKQFNFWLGIVISQMHSRKNDDTAHTRVWCFFLREGIFSSYLTSILIWLARFDKSISEHVDSTLFKTTDLNKWFLVFSFARYAGCEFPLHSAVVIGKARRLSQVRVEVNRIQEAATGCSLFWRNHPKHKRQSTLINPPLNMTTTFVLTTTHLNKTKLLLK